MRIINEYKDPLVHTLREGNSTDPYIEMDELQIIQNNRILLSEIPNRLQRVQLEVKGYAKARLQFKVDEIKNEFSIFIGDEEYTINKSSSIRQALRELTKSINGVSEYVYAVYFLSAKTVNIVAKNSGSIGNTITVNTNVDINIAEWQDRNGNPTSNLVDGTDLIETYHEIEEGIPKEREFKVDYTLGTIEFHESANGSIGEFKYFGRGLTYYPASRVWVRLENNTVIETLENLIEDAQILIEELKDIEFSLVATGEYNANKIYQRRNIAVYEGSSYMFICDKPAFGLTPTLSDCWKLVAQKGDKGDPGLNIKFRGAYDKNRTYYHEDAVEFNGSLYYCHTESTGIFPTDTNYWYLLVSGGGTKDYRNTVKITVPQDTINIGISQYSKGRDILIVHANSTFIEEDVDYNIIGNTSIVSKSGEWDADTEFNFLVIRNVNVPNVMFDGEFIEDDSVDGSHKLIDGSVTTDKIKDDAIVTSKISDGSVTMPKLGNDVMQELNKIYNHSHDAGDIVSGVFNIARIPSLSTSKTTSGVFHIDRIPNIPGNKIIGSVTNAINAERVGGYTLEELVDLVISDFHPTMNMSNLKVYNADGTDGGYSSPYAIVGSGWFIAANLTSNLESLRFRRGGTGLPNPVYNYVKIDDGFNSALDPPIPSGLFPIRYEESIGVSVSSGSYFSVYYIPDSL